MAEGSASIPRCRSRLRRWSRGVALALLVLLVALTVTAFAYDWRRTATNGPRARCTPAPSSASTRRFSPIAAGASQGPR
jgi:hypothetical protein